MQKYNTLILENGLKLVAHKMPNMRSVSLGVWIKVGGRHEDMESRGISHFIEHLLFKGTQKRSAAEIKNSIEGVGGSLNAFTSEEMTCYLAKVPAKYQKLGLTILSDMVLNARFDPKDIEKERMVIQEEIKMYKDQPDQYVHEMLAELMWPKQILGIPLIGTYDIINSLKRSDFIKFRKKTYGPGNITIVACGDIEWEKLVLSCKEIFYVKRKADYPEYESMRLTQKGAQSNFFKKDTEQTHVAIGFHGMSRFSPDRVAMDILNVALGANMSSRLFHELREKRGLAYAISSHVSYFRDGGAVVIEAGVDSEKLVSFTRLALNELAKIKTRLLSKNEFDRAKEYYRGYLSFILEDTLSHMLWIGRKIVTGDKPMDVNKILDNIAKVTREDILDIAKRLFRGENLNISVIGPIGDDKKVSIDRIVKTL